MVTCFTSFWIVNLTLILLLWGSVQMNPASTNRTLFKPFNFFKHSVNSSRDSSSAVIHMPGGWRYRSQLRQKWICTCFGMPSVISTSLRIQLTHMLAALGGVGAPHPGHYSHRPISRLLGQDRLCRVTYQAILKNRLVHDFGISIGSQVYLHELFLNDRVVFHSLEIESKSYCGIKEQKPDCPLKRLRNPGGLRILLRQRGD